MKAWVIGGRITLLGVTGTPNDWQRPVINAGNPRALLDLSGSRGCLVGGTCKQIDGVSDHLSHVDAHPCQDGIHQLTLWKREIGVMIARQDIVEQQCHPRLGQGGHAGAHDPHSPPCSGPGEILPRCA